MENRKIYEDIATRTNGDIYIGVVGPVRTGKSTFIKRFMETLVIPNIENVYRRERAKDELPQSGSGRTVMTAEPKFVPEEAVEINLDDSANMRVRLIDCVGYMVNGALGQFEDGQPRMVVTPWSEDEIPMSEAAELGTHKVISEHSTIGLVITTDGSVTDLAREDYIEAEERVIAELKAIDKPFLLVINTAHPHSDDTRALREELAQKYDVTCVSMDCSVMTENDIEGVIRSVLYEFPVKQVGVVLPGWFDSLDTNHPVKTALYTFMLESAKSLSKVRDIAPFISGMSGCEHVCGAKIQSINLGDGSTVAEIELPRGIFYAIVEEQTGFRMSDDSDILPLLKGLSTVKYEYDKLASALKQVRDEGYGIVMPSMEELHLEEPEIVKQGGKFGVRLRASAPSIHMIRADIETEVSPIVGSEKQSEELVKYLLKEFDGDPGKIWESNIFGKSLNELVSEGLHSKLNKMPVEARCKLQETLQRIINEGSGGLICIIL